MAMERTEYPAMLAALQPAQAVDVLNDRVRQVGKLNTEIADWLQERRRLEELYSNGLRKLARKQINGADLGVFSAPWSTLTNSAENLADSHSALAGKIEVDVERPLRQFASGNREMQNMTNMQGNLSALARDVDRAQQKTERLQSKGDTGKIAGASSELDSAQAQWESQAPYVFENLQAVDEARWNHLRDVLTQFQTHEVDQVEKHRVAAEGVLNVLLNVETVDEIKTFALRTVENKPSLQRNRPSTAASTFAASGSTPSRASETSAPPTPSLQPPDDDARSASVQEEKKKNPLGRLKRFGTVMRSSRRESKMPQQLQPMSESPERPAKSSPMNSFSGRFGRSKEKPNLDAPAESNFQQRPRSPLRMGSEVLDAPQRPSREPSNPSPVAERQAPNTNGYAAAGGGAVVGALGGAALAANIPNGSHQSDLADLEPPKPAEPEPAFQSSVAEPARDNEGYSVPPSQIDAISQAQQDAEASGESVPPQFNVNIRNAPIEEGQSADADAALASMASKLQMQAPALNNRRLGTVRGRREARNSFVPPAAEDPAEPSQSTGPQQFAPITLPPVEPAPVEREMPPPDSATTSATSPFPASPPASSPVQGSITAFSPFPTNEPSSPFNRPTSPPMFRAAQLNADHDNHSIRSGRSLASTTSQSHRHPDLPAPGLNASIIETLSARFESSNLVSSSLTGEIALAYNLTEPAPASGSETLRLDNFASLDKVAPNPAFISPIEGKAGEYGVSLSTISGKTQIAFKYQVRVDDSPAAQPPLLIAPAFKIEPAQASVIVSYSLNPNFVLPAGRQSLTLTGVVLALTLEGAKATSCLSKPVGTFSREKNLIFWTLGDVTLTPGAAPTKLLARFATEGEAASGGAVEARWEILGEESKGVGSGLGVSVSSSEGSSDPFADEEVGGPSAWKSVEGGRKLVAGTYVVK